MNIFVGNLPWDTTEDELRNQFGEFGQVTSATIITDKMSHRSRGFGFVEMPKAAEAQNSITNLNGKPFKGRNLTVNEARPRPEDGRSRDQEPSAQPM